MSEQKFIEMQMDFLSGKLRKKDKDAFESYLQSHPEQLESFHSLKESWEHLGVLPDAEPSKQMDQKFYAFLDKELQKNKAVSPSLWEQLNAYFFEKRLSFSVGQLAFALAILLLGVWLGSKTQAPISQAKENIANTNTEIEEVRTQLFISLIEQNSASKRLQAVSEVNKLNELSHKVIDALLQTLNKDPNTNVRLAALESLIKYINLPEVRQGLATSIAHQESPLVQIALAELMVRLQEKGALESMKKLLNKPEIDKTVKQKIEESILQI